LSKKSLSDFPKGLVHDLAPPELDRQDEEVSKHLTACPIILACALVLLGCEESAYTGAETSALDAASARGLEEVSFSSPTSPASNQDVESDEQDASDDIEESDSEDTSDGETGGIILPPNPERDPPEDIEDIEDQGGQGPIGEDTGPSPSCQTNAECEASGPCTKGQCYAGECIQVMHNDPCDDGDPCTENDTCNQGVCLGEISACDDGDPCTSDDTCTDGECEGTPILCDDLNTCTSDLCYEGECKHLVSDTPACALTLEVFSPLRAATIVGDENVDVVGEVNAPAGGLLTLLLNGQEVTVNPSGTFVTTVPARSGINILIFEASDHFERTTRVVQSYAYGQGVLPPGTMNQPTPLEGSLVGWLDNDVFDDDDLSDLDDLATLVHTIIAGFDLNAALPEPLLAEEDKPSFGWCTWDVEVSDIAIELDDIALYPGVEKLALEMSFSDFYAWVGAKAGGACPDAIGSATSERITVSGTLELAINAQGVNVDLTQLSVDIDEIELDIQEGVGQLFDWLINWFEDDLTLIVREEIENAVIQEVAPLLSELLETIADFTYDFEVPAIPPNDQTLDLRLVVSPTQALLTPEGLEIELSAAFGVEKAISHESPGSLIGVCSGNVQSAAGSSCFGACGASAPSGCRCDEGCIGSGECCDDYWSVCAEAPTTGLGACCADTDSPGCSANLPCESCVCDADPYCCNFEWDYWCAAKAEAECNGACGCGESCCQVDTPQGCLDQDCETCICDQDPYCCDTKWDILCVAMAEQACAQFCGCYSGKTTLGDSALEHLHPIELMAPEAIINRFFFALWWGGHMNFNVDNAQLEESVGDLGLPGLSLSVDPHLPPIVTACTDSGDYELQLGDVLMKASFELLGVVQSVTFFVSARVGIELGLVEGTNALQTLGLEIGEVLQTTAQLMATSGDSPLLDNIDNTFIEGALGQLFISDYLSGVSAAIPVKVVDLNEYIPGLSSATTLAFEATALQTKGAAVIVGGRIADLPP